MKHGVACLAAVVVVASVTAGCGSGSGKTSTAVTTATHPPASTASSVSAPGSSAAGSGSTPTPVDPADAALIAAMYATINAAFQRKPDDGVRALIAAQYPGDRVDVDFARCVSAIVPGAKTLPASKRLRFTPKMTALIPDPTYILTSNRVRNLHPSGRIYMTEVTITEGTASTVRPRHQVVVNGRAYQFSEC